MLRTTIASALMIVTAVVTGCGQPSTAGNDAAIASIDKAKFILAEEPDEAVGVIIAREDAKDKDDIVLLGRIGGRKNPWIDGRSAFMVIDAAMTVVADGTESAEGEVCLDDCCAALRKDMTTLVKIVDEKGRTLPVDARKLFDLAENDMVVYRVLRPEITWPSCR